MIKHNDDLIDWLEKLENGIRRIVNHHDLFRFFRNFIIRLSRPSLRRANLKDFWARIKVKEERLGSLSESDGHAGEDWFKKGCSWGRGELEGPARGE